MPKLTEEIRILNPQGLHARPAALFVQAASKYASDVTVQKDDEVVNGKSIMGLLTLAIENGVKVRLDVDGDDAEAAMAELKELLSRENIDE